MKKPDSLTRSTRFYLQALLLSFSHGLIVSFSPTHAAEPSAWMNISEALCTKLDAMEYIGKNGKPWNWMRRTQGIAADPVDGRVFLHITAHEAGTFVSKDQGATWEKLGDSQITGRGELAGDLRLHVREIQSFDYAAHQLFSQGTNLWSNWRMEYKFKSDED